MERKKKARAQRGACEHEDTGVKLLFSLPTQCTFSFFHTFTILPSPSLFHNDAKREKRRRRENRVEKSNEYQS